ncbi:MAG: hypothetical protein ACU0CA_05850 [Paracoccaceae bacterium]
MFKRTIIALLVLHISACLLILFTGGAIFAFVLLIGRGYVFFLNLIAVNLIAQITAASAACTFLILLFWPFSAWRVSARLVGVLPIVVFFAAGEVASRTAMHSARKAHATDACLFGVRPFTFSALGATARVDFFSSPNARHHHAHIALSNGTVLIWSYREMDFVEMRPGTAKFQRIPDRCNP